MQQKTSFSQSAKLEVLNTKITNDCCAFAFLSGVIKGSGALKKVDSKPVVEIYTDLKSLYDVINDIVKQYYGVECQMEIIHDYIALKIIRYKIVLPVAVSFEILKDISVTEIDDRNNVVKVSGIDKHIIANDCCKRSFIKGAFVSSATSNIVIKKYDNTTKNTSGYHLEFVFDNKNLAHGFVELLMEYNLPSKVTIRKGTPIVYIKEYQVISDILALVGAVKAVLSLQNEAAIREVRNNVNRQVNCFNANLSKMIASSLRQLDAINYINETIGIQELDEPLMELAMLRIANPEEPLEKLRQLYSYEISKSGINHRFEKIIKIANKLKEEHSKLEDKNNANK